eukprot:CAMPEP_0202961894 /NCGR_PEP_ID=MMETSP1396-20130829/5989_1 /ASSEMBLY_ACC=CAM_ASM_000872 /TAXON_ID= /ORGANISM="Pseudokeronopsis sp., Strain Brazil" /LENGTH=294 /DNA_ID=CAMNT_0049682093 /DNA_START=264 /DNA_END=1148 /DNA_ORIENTATION=+
MVGVSFNTARITISIFAIFIFLIFQFSGVIMLSLRVPEEVVAYAVIYVKNLVPALYFMGLFDAYRRYMNCYALSYVPMVIQACTILLHCGLCYIFVHRYNMEIKGVTLSMNIATFTQLALIMLYATFQQRLREAYFLPNKESLVQLKEFAKLAFFCSLSTIPETSTFELMTLLANYISVNATAAQVCLINFSGIIFMITQGFQMATATMVGKSVGEGSLVRVKDYTRFIIIQNICMNAVILVLINIFRAYVPRMYTDEESVRELVARTLPVYSSGLIADGLQGIFMGVYRGFAL